MKNCSQLQTTNLKKTTKKNFTKPEKQFHWQFLNRGKKSQKQELQTKNMENKKTIITTGKGKIERRKPIRMGEFYTFKITRRKTMQPKIHKIQKKLAIMMKKMTTPSKNDFILFKDCQGDEPDWENVLHKLSPRDFEEVCVVVTEYPEIHPHFTTFWCNSKTGKYPEPDREITKKEILNQDFIPRNNVHEDYAFYCYYWTEYFNELKEYNPSYSTDSIFVFHPELIKGQPKTEINIHLKKWLTHWCQIHNKVWLCYSECHVTDDAKPKMYAEVFKKFTRSGRVKLEDGRMDNKAKMRTTMAYGWIDRFLERHKSNLISGETLMSNIIVIPSEKPQESERISITLTDYNSKRKKARELSSWVNTLPLHIKNNI